MCLVEVGLGFLFMLVEGVVSGVFVFMRVSVIGWVGIFMVMVLRLLVVISGIFLCFGRMSVSGLG